MLKRITHTFIHVLDQDEALDFYVGKLGMVVNTDADLGRPIEVVTDMTKSRKLGFLDYQPIDDSFFDLHGESLMAVRLVSSIQDRLSIELLVSDIFDAPTVAELDQQLAKVLQKSQA